MSQFVQFFEEQVMVLWKFALLRRRILIFSPPPVGEVCYRGKEMPLAWNMNLFHCYHYQFSPKVINIQHIHI